MENKIKVALVNPRMFIKAYSFFPLALGYLAAALENEKIPYSFYDLHIDWGKNTEFIKQVKRDGVPDLFAITGLLTSFQNVRDLIETIKENFPVSQVVLGGKITVMGPEFLFAHTGTDFIIQGEGEIALVELVNEIENNHTYDTVQGLSYRDEYGNVISHGEAKPVRTLSEYSIPYERFDMGKYIERCNIQSPDVRSINILSSRGCPFTCTFCNNSGTKSPVRFYDISGLKDSLDYLITNFQLKHVTFNDDIFTVNKRHMKEICECLKERNLSFSISTRLDFLDEESIKNLDESGCSYLCIGIESPSPIVAKVIDKELDLKKYQKNIDALKSSNIVVNFGFIFGYLGETEESIKETREFVLKNKIIYSAFFANAFPKTRLYDLIREKIPDEEEYLKRLFKVDLSKDYLVNMTDIPSDRLYLLRDQLIADSVINAINITIPLPKQLLRMAALAYLVFMRKYGLRFSLFKQLFEFLNMIVVKPLTKKAPA
ncbi:MAG: radical SAM protein [Candidatus Scalindua sp. AMX11]|nr:MAG: radical SAM protein [Candidatus Scalindua sp.]NOG82240.1 B12-binding domain-containing radical SAM protein [Planctomycetota bacterium]RZV71468.1 MAG: B12-binding domain-containing radical SAM protein [Candidatus Scalindua sp. SCAELEC01]TDE64268.1 MAG: radical SAM protein [Candidatus Scalindua sp. AMX11]GJQ59906.1 MAG: B12-binding domain-containing radical SAM protein [Candidatus Scalindua sp.]